MKDVAGLCLSTMRALWGIVTPNLRGVSVEEKDSIISVYFYYDMEPSQEEIELSEEAATEIIADFPEPHQISCQREVINYPRKINFQGYLIYSRYEK